MLRAAAVLVLCCITAHRVVAGTRSLGEQLLRDSSPYIDSAMTNVQFSALQTGAERGDAAKAYQLALLYLYGHRGGVQLAEAPTMSAKFMRQAAENGYAHAQTAMGVMLLDGLGVGRDRKSALRWLRTAASDGSKAADANAMWLLGVELMKEGKGEEGGAWLERAATALEAHAGALFALGVGYEYGQLDPSRPGLGEDAVERHELSRAVEGGMQGEAMTRSAGAPRAVALYQMAADAGHLDATYHLALCLLYGRGAHQDMPRAASLLQTAALRGHGAAAFWLGTVLMQNGKGGIDADYERARSLFEQAVASNDPRVDGLAKRASAELEELLERSRTRREEVIGMIRGGWGGGEQGEEPTSEDWEVSAQQAEELTQARRSSAEKRTALGDALARARAAARDANGARVPPHGSNLHQGVFGD